MNNKDIFRQIFQGTTFVVFLVIVLFIPSFSQSTVAITENVSFDNEGVTLSGILTFPATGGPFPGVVLFSGSGPQDRDGFTRAIPGYKPFAVIAEHLADNGYAVLRYDDRGVGESSGDYIKATEDDFIKDAESAVKYLMSRNEIDAKYVGVLGHSEGALIAAQVSANIPDVVFIISLAGGAVDGKSLLLRQAQRQAEAEGMSSDDVAKLIEQQSHIFDLVLAKDWQELTDVVKQLILTRLKALPNEKTAQIGDLEAFAKKRAAQSVNTFKHPRYQYLLHHDFGADWAKVSVPVLALFGELDVQCDANQNMIALKNILTKAGNTKGTIKVIPNANHLFITAKTGSLKEYAGLPKEFAPGFLDSISDWLQKRTGDPPA